MKLSNQAMGSIMMALQKCLLEQTDIVPILEDFKFSFSDEEGLKVDNPPNFKIGEDTFNPTAAEKVNTIGSD
tara:strand:+ start:378 stop:593 length:216 start_codon:yes stop_codon:yes gene_type:complete